MTPQEKLAQQVHILELLAAVDQGLRQMEGQMSQGQGAMEALRRELAFLDGKLEADRTSLEEMQRTAGELVGEARQMSAQIEKSRDKMGRARNEREVMNAEREMEELRRLQRDREEEVGKLNALVDAAKKSIADVQAKRDKVHKELSENEGSTTSSLAEVRQTHEKKLAERNELAKKLPPLVLRRYEAILRRKGSGIARVVDGTCQACHVGLPPQFFQKLMRRETLEECPSCHRILYWAPAPANAGGAP